MTRLTLRATLASALVVLLAGLVAAACGGSSSGVAASAKGLDFVPRSALLYAVLDTDFSGSNWKTADTHLRKFSGYATQRDSLAHSLCDNTGATYAHDVKPWLGKTGGVALVGKQSDKGTKAVGWLEVNDKTKAEQCLASSGAKHEGSFKGYDLTSQQGKADSSPTFYTFAKGGDLLVFSSDKASLQQAISAKQDGPNVLADAGVKDVAAKSDPSSIATLVISGSSLRDWLGQAQGAATSGTGKQGLGSIGSLDQVKAMKAASISVQAEGKGFRLRGYVGYDAGKLSGKQAGSNQAFDLLGKLPADTKLAVGGSDLGGIVRQVIDGVQRGNPKTATQIKQAEALLGITVADVEQAMSGQYAIGVRAGGGTTPAIGAVFEARDEAKNRRVFDTLFAAAASQGSAPTKDVTVAGERAKQATVGGIGLFESTFAGATVLSNDSSFIAQVKGGSNGLGSSSTFTNAKRDAKAPDTGSMLLYVDTQGLLKLAGSLLPGTSSSNTALGPILAWSSGGSDHQTFDLFVSIDDSAPDAPKGSTSGAAGLLGGALGKATGGGATATTTTK